MIMNMSYYQQNDKFVRKFLKSPNTTSFPPTGDLPVRTERRAGNPWDDIDIQINILTF